MPHVNEVDRRVLDAMSGAERVRMLLREAGFKTLSEFAYKVGTHVQTISYCINGERRYPEIRDAIADHLGITRKEVDEMIDGSTESDSPAIAN